MRSALVVAGILLTSILRAGVVHAGTVIVVDEWAYDQYSESGVYTVYLDRQKARVEVTSKDGEAFIIYRLDDEDNLVMYMVEPQTETYAEYDTKIIKKSKDHYQAQMEQMDSYLQSMSAEDRENIKKRFRKELRMADFFLNYEERMKKMEYEKTAEGVEVGEWKCDEYKGVFKKDHYMDVWVADWKQLNTDKNDMILLTRMAEVFEGFAGGMIPYAEKKVKGLDAPLDGFPVRMIRYEDGNKIVRQEVKEIRQEDTDPKLFELPEGYEKTEPQM